ncbi:MAG: GTPase Era [Firmicutes bacterium]|nr:GTPase Era [Bacillota bacterium]
MKSGFVSLIGRPNVGKSTLLNSIIGKKVAITSNKPQTTRNIIQGIYNDSDTQIVFVDTPGIHKPKYKLGNYLNKQAYYSIGDVDVVLFLVDITEEFGKGDLFVLDKIKEENKPVILILNKIDKIKKEDILIKIAKYKDLYPFKEIVPLSALKKDNVSELLNVLKQYLPDNVKYFMDDEYTNQRTEFLISEIVREKVFNKTEEEVPHSVTCVVEQIKKDKDKLILNVAIIVDRDSLKKIIIGKQGSKIKEIGIESRIELEKLLDKKVYLELFVRTIKNWRDKEKYLQEFGFKDFEN